METKMIKTIFNAIDKEVEEAIKNDHCEKYLWDLYDRDGLKKYMGSAAQFTGLSEYLFLKALLLLLENEGIPKIDINLKQAYTGLQDPCYYFLSSTKDIVVTHNLELTFYPPYLKDKNYNPKKGKTKKFKPDIVVFKIEGGIKPIDGGGIDSIDPNKITPIAIFQLKICSSASGDLQEDINKIEKFPAKHRFAIFDPPILQLLNFEKNKNTKIIVYNPLATESILKEDKSRIISFNEACKKITEEIKKCSK